MKMVPEVREELARAWVVAVAEDGLSAKLRAVMPQFPLNVGPLRVEFVPREALSGAQIRISRHGIKFSSKL